MNRLPLSIFLAACILTAEIKSFAKPAQYSIKNVRGWPIHVSEEVLADNKQKQLFKILDEKLEEVSSGVSPEALKVLQSIPIWIDLDITEGVLGPIDYHPSSEWLIIHNLNPDWAHSVEIASVTGFLESISKHPGILSVFLADGYYDYRYHYDPVEMEKLLIKLQESKSGTRFLNETGINLQMQLGKITRILFRELSTAYLSHAEHYPFTRSDLKDFSPDAYKVMDSIWAQ